MCGREYQDFRRYACLEGIPHEGDPDYDWKFQIYRAGMNAVRDKARVPSSPGSSESGSDDDYISSERNHESLAHNGDFHYPNNMLFVSPPTCPFSHHFFRYSQVHLNLLLGGTAAYSGRTMTKTKTAQGPAMVLNL